MPIIKDDENNIHEVDELPRTCPMCDSHMVLLVDEGYYLTCSDQSDKCHADIYQAKSHPSPDASIEAWNSMPVFDRSKEQARIKELEDTLQAILDIDRHTRLSKREQLTELITQLDNYLLNYFCE